MKIQKLIGKFHCLIPLYIDSLGHCNKMNFTKGMFMVFYLIFNKLTYSYKESIIILAKFKEINY